MAGKKYKKNVRDSHKEALGQQIENPESQGVRVRFETS